eukprot:gene16639-19769_t
MSWTEKIMKMEEFIERYMEPESNRSVIENGQEDVMLPADQSTQSPLLAR